MSQIQMTVADARKHWMVAQGLHQKDFFGEGVKATYDALEQLGYVQIDTINVIERSHHHILFSRVSDYKKAYLHQMQTVDKSIFEYWTHALAYVPTKDYPFFLSSMKRVQKSPGAWLGGVTPAEMKKVRMLMLKQGPLSIRDISDDTLVEKEHPWASKKPSKKALQLGFYTGKFVISERVGMLKKYDLAEKHFQWEKKPKTPTRNQELDYLLERALRSQAVVNLDSICYLRPSLKSEMSMHIHKKVRSGLLNEVRIKGFEKMTFWANPKIAEVKAEVSSELVHILSPFDPLVIQRKRLLQFFDYDYRFEAYLPKEKRKFGYFALPIFIGERVVAVVDFKMDRQQQRLLVQAWTWLPKQQSKKNKISLELAIHQFQDFQMNS